MPDRVSHERAVDLLPWLVNDSLDSSERQGVLEHSRNCVVCRRELDELERLRDSIATPAEAPSPDMRNINARIDALNARRNRAGTIMSAARRALDNPWRVAFAVQSLLLIVVAGLLFRPDTGAPVYSTLTESVELPSGDYVRIVFTPELSHTELSMFLDRFELRVVDGPSVRGVYTLGIADSMSPKDRDRLVLFLQQDARVLFAQPVTHGVEQ